MSDLPKIFDCTHVRHIPGVKTATFNGVEFEIFYARSRLSFGGTNGRDAERPLIFIDDRLAEEARLDVLIHEAAHAYFGDSMDEAEVVRIGSELAKFVWDVLKSEGDEAIHARCRRDGTTSIIIDHSLPIRSCAPLLREINPDEPAFTTLKSPNTKAEVITRLIDGVAALAPAAPPGDAGTTNQEIR